MDTRAVVEHHLAALEEGDVDAVLADYVEESVLVTTGMVVRGLEHLRTLFEGALATMFKPGAHEFTLDTLDVDGEIGLITWRLRFEGGEVTHGVDSFVVRGGKIIAQTGAVQLA